MSELKECLRTLPGESKVVLAIIGIEGMNTDLKKWKSLAKEFQGKAGLRIYLLIGETMSQWEKADVKWTAMYWSVTILERYWAVFNLDKIVDEDVLDTPYKKCREE